MSISENWTGYFLNYLAAENTPNFVDKFLLPDNIDWKKDLNKNVYLEADSPENIGFLWSYKVWKLYVNSESEEKESLPEPIPIVVGKYHYGNFSGLEPKKQDLVLFCYYRESFGSPLELKPYKTLRNPLKKPGAREEIPEMRRSMAESYIKQRAKEIDVATAEILTVGHPLRDAAIAAGVQNLDLATGIKTYFEQFSNEMFVYRRSGSSLIFDAITAVMADSAPSQNGWMKENILIDLAFDEQGQPIFSLVPAGAIISSIFQEAITEVSQLQINEKAAEVS